MIRSPCTAVEGIGRLASPKYSPTASTAAAMLSTDMQTHARHARACAALRLGSLLLLLHAPFTVRPATEPNHQSGGKTHPNAKRVHKILADQHLASCCSAAQATAGTSLVELYLCEAGGDAFAIQFDEEAGVAESNASIGTACVAATSGTTRPERPPIKDGHSTTLVLSMAMLTVGDC